MASKRKQARDLEYERKVKEYRKLAKVADQRLIRLKELSKVQGFKNVLSWAYSKAMRNIKYWTGEKSERFNTKPPNDLRLLKAKIRDIQEFIDSPTSWKRGILKVYKKRADTINKKYGTKFTWENIAGYFERKDTIKTDSEYGSKTMLMAIGEIQSNEKKIIKAIKKGEDIDLHIDNEQVADAVNDLIRNYGLGVVNLY